MKGSGLQMTSEECRRDSNKSVDKAKRYYQIQKILRSKGNLTAKEVAIEMYREKYINAPERNYAAPRLTELKDFGLVRTIGKRKCQYTGKVVSVYELVDKPKEWEQITLGDVS